MSLAAVWGNHERPDHPSLWMAADSRISDGSDPLIDEGMKLFEVPVICRGLNANGFFDQPFDIRSVGMVAVGGSLVFQHVYGTMVAMLSNLIGVPGAGPTNANIAEFAAQLTTIYVRSLGASRPQGASLIEIAIGGISKIGKVEGFKIGPEIKTDGLIEFIPKQLDTRPGQVHFMGDKHDRARELCDEIRKRDEPGAPRERAALNVIRAFIDDPSIGSVGGEVQVGHTIGASFRRVVSVRPVEIGSPQARMALNAIDLASIDSVGPCLVAPMGMVTP